MLRRLVVGAWLLTFSLALGIGLGQVALPAHAEDGPREVEPSISPVDRAAAIDSLLADPSLPPEFKAYALEQILLGHEEDGEPWVHEAADALGRICVTLGRTDEAIHYLELAVEGRPDDADLLNTLGYVYAEENRELPRAEELIRRALATAPSDTPGHVIGYYRDSLGWVFFQQGRMDSAVVTLEAANHLAPGTPEIRDHLVEVYDEIGRRDDAAAILVEDLVAARGMDPDLRARLRRLYRTTPEGKPLPVELEVERQVLAREIAEVEAIEAAGGSVIRFDSMDGFPLVATWYPTRSKAKAPSVVLLPMFGGERKDFDPLARALVESGMNALTLDPRGHGASITAEVYGPGAFVENIPAFIHGAILDVTAAIRHLGEHPASRGQSVAVVGASLGGMVGALGALDEDAVKALVLLSPGPAEPFTEAVTLDRHRPTLLIASAEDPTAMAGAEIMLAGLDRTRSEVLVYPGQSHGTALLEEVDELVPRIVRWLGGTFKDARGL